MENDFSAIKSLNELKNLLDSGAITQEEYDVLKRKVIFGNNPAPPPTSGNNAAAPPAYGNSPAAPPANPNEPFVPGPIPTSSLHVTPPPAKPEEPVASKPIFTKTPVVPPPPTAVEGNPLTPEYERVVNNPVPAAGNPVPENIAHARNIAHDYLNSPVNQPEELKEVKKKDWLLTILITLGALLLLGLIAYQLMGDKESENLTSKSGPDTEEIASEEGGLIEADAADAATSTRSDRIADSAGLAEPVPAATIPDATTAPDGSAAANTTTPPATPAISNEEALNRIKDRLESYYDDIESAPFSAQRHFAPTVERYYTLVNTTPAAINENINSYHFNEFQNSESTIEEGTMKLENNSANGFEITYLENGKAFRKSKGQQQETKARVRARFNPDFKMTYFRQEQLLENRFLDE